MLYARIYAEETANNTSSSSSSTAADNKSFKFTKNTQYIPIRKEEVLEKAHVEEDMDDTQRLR
jgi:hypothetical protein